MLDNQVKTTALDVIGEMTLQNKSFTAFDVTKEVRTRLGSGVQVPHYNGVRDLVESQFRDGSMSDSDDDQYLREVRNVAGFSDAYVYYPPAVTSTPTSAPSTSSSNTDGFLSAASVSARYATSGTIIPVAVPAPTCAPSDEETKSVSKYNRLRIPKHILNEAGFQTGDDVWVVFDTDNDSLTLQKYTPNSGISRHFKVDRYGNIRIGLAKVGIKAQVFELEVDTDKVVAKGS